MIKCVFLNALENVNLRKDVLLASPVCQKNSLSKDALNDSYDQHSIYKLAVVESSSHV